LISVVVVSPTDLERALKSRQLSGYKVITYSGVRDVRSAGFRLIPTFLAPHYSLELPDATDTSLGRLIDIYKERMENPFYER
jgi:hypothetical protein